MSAFYVDVHTHLTDPAFDQDRNEVIQRAKKAELGAIVVNGLDPVTNRQILSLSKQDTTVKAALGIYPIHAVNALLAPDFPLKIEKFDVFEEINFIREMARNKQLIAIGECGLDGHWLTPDTFPQQEAVFTKLIEISIDYKIPIIVHSRKREQRTIEILAAWGAKKVNMHCFGGKSKLACQAAEHYNWCFSIPANAKRSHGFQKLLEDLPISSILTETDAPYLSPMPGIRSEPSDVVQTVELFAQLKGWDLTKAREVIWTNYVRLFTEVT